METKKSVTLLDGGLGQEVYRRSQAPAHPLWSVKVMRDKPHIVREVHEDFIRGGARVLTLNTYTATPTRLNRDGDLAWFESVQKQAFQLADEARRACKNPFGSVQLAGCLPPLVASYRPTEAHSYADGLKEYQQIVRAQPDVDLFIGETLSSIAEGRAAAEAVRPTGKPMLLSFTLRDDGSNALRSGESVEAAVAAVAAVKDLKLAGILFNCSTPETIQSALPFLSQTGLPFGAYANGFESVESLKTGGTVDVLSTRTDLDPEAYGKYVESWLDMGASIIGGCCEVGPAHIKRLHRLLVDRQVTITGVA